MAEFYDCYLKTKNKKAIEKFKGVPVHDLHSYEEVKDLPEYQDDLKDGEQKEESVSEPIVLNLEGLSCSIQEGVDCTIQIKGGKYSVSFSNMDESDQTETHPDWFEYAEMGVIMALGIGFIISMGKISRLKKKSVKNDSGRFDE